MRKKTVAIIIVTWNGISDTLACLDSLAKIDYQDYEVIIVDNNSSDQTVNTLRERFPSIKIIVNDQNLGFAPAVNIGIGFAIQNNFEYVLLLNNDTIVERTFLSSLVSEISKSIDIGIVGSKIYYYGTDKLVWFAGGKFNIKSGFFHNLEQLTKNPNLETKKVDFVSGCSMLFRTALVNEIGYFNEIYQSYVEDVEFNLKTKDSGRKILLVGSSLIWHKVSRSTGGDGSGKKTFLKTRNIIYFASHYLYEKIGIDAYLYLSKYLIQQIIISIKHRNRTMMISILKGIPAGIILSV